MQGTSLLPVVLNDNAVAKPWIIVIGCVGGVKWIYETIQPQQVWYGKL